jgi:hypothetical protein
MFYLKVALTITACALVATISDTIHAASRNWNTEAREPFHYDFPNDKGIDVDNVNGAIQVIGDGGKTIRVEGERIVRADDQDAVNRAKNEVKLDVNEKDGVAQFYVNGPFRANNNHASDDHGFHFHYDDHRYEVTYNFTIHVPHETALELRTVNGEIKTADTRGKFDIHGVNGSVNMTGVAGSGTLHTVNGRTSVAFSEPPKAPSSFQTVNGAIDAAFPPNLAADIHLKTLNGAAYTDFESTAALPATAEAGERKNGRFVFRSNHTSNLRIGAGGPELSFETVNGNISIKKETR